MRVAMVVPCVPVMDLGPRSPITVRLLVMNVPCVAAIVIRMLRHRGSSLSRRTRCPLSVDVSRHSSGGSAFRGERRCTASSPPLVGMLVARPRASALFDVREAIVDEVTNEVIDHAIACRPPFLARRDEPQQAEQR